MPVTISPYALTTLESAKEHLGIPALTTTFDDRIKRLINAATGNIETYCDRFLKQRTGLTEYQDGIAHNRLILGQWPIANCEVWIDHTSQFTDPATKLLSTDFAIERSSKGEGVGIVLLTRIFPRGFRNIKVVYDGGYATVPAELEDCCIWTVDYFNQMLTERSVDTETKGKNQENTTYRGELPQIVKRTLDAYKKTEFVASRALQTW